MNKLSPIHVSYIFSFFLFSQNPSRGTALALLALMALSAVSVEGWSLKQRDLDDLIDDFIGGSDFEDIQDNTTPCCDVTDISWCGSSYKSSEDVEKCFGGERGCVTCKK